MLKCLNKYPNMFKTQAYKGRETKIDNNEDVKTLSQALLSGYI